MAFTIAQELIELLINIETPNEGTILHVGVYACDALLVVLPELGASPAETGRLADGQCLFVAVIAVVKAHRRRRWCTVILSLFDT